MSQTADLKIIRRDDLIPPAINLKYRVTVSSESQKSVHVIHDICCNIPLAAGGSAVVEGIGYVGDLESLAQFVAGSGTIDSTDQATLQSFARRPGTPAATIDLEGPNITQQAIVSSAIPVTSGVLSAPGSDGGFWTTVFPDLKNVASLAFYNADNPPPVCDDTDPAVDLTTYGYRLIDGAIAGWMTTSGGSPALAKQVTVKAWFTYQDQAVGHATVALDTAAYHEKTIRLTLGNLPTGTYQIATPGEVIPYGLAGFIYNIESIPQYQGNYTIVEQDITDQCPMGNNLNLTGSLAEWATMNACVQEIEYDLDTGRTTLTFGPAAHLGAQDFVERLRVNRGPRWFYLNGGNATNAPNNNSNPSNIIQKDGNSTIKIFGQLLFPTTLPIDQGIGGTAPAVPSGVSVNCQADPGSGASGAAVSVNAGGASGTGAGWILLAASDLGGNNIQIGRASCR